MTSDSGAPSKASLKLWWQAFTATKHKKEGDFDDGKVASPVFGTPLKESLNCASVQISTSNINGELLIWGYIPVVVAKCGLYLKTNATEVPGTFRVNGSNKRMRELQTIFETPPKYGKNLDWRKGGAVYTTHDVASVFRRYLTQMPEPVIPHDLYHKFRDALSKTPYDQQEIIATYKRLIGSMPRANQYLLLYVLDLLSVFARKSDKNLMTAGNLAVIFRPGLISHPNHEMSPTEHNLSQKVLEFLIAHQDWFLLDIPPAPESTPGTPATAQHTGEDDDIIVAPSSDEDQTSQRGGSGGWKAAVRGAQISRRKTTLEKRDSPSIQEKRSAPLSPVLEPVAPGREGSAGVTRSRTLPSGRKGSTAGGVEHDRKILRKQKRSSSQKRGDVPGG